MSVGTWSAFHSPYDEDQVRLYAPAAAGLYCLWVRYDTGRWGCFYVGKADNIEERLLGHLSSQETNSCIRKNRPYTAAFMWIPITMDAERSGAEKFLYDALKPECNETDPGGTPLRIPLPMPG